MICDRPPVNQDPQLTRVEFLCYFIPGNDQAADFESDLKGFPGRYWHALGDDRIQCDL